MGSTVAGERGTMIGREVSVARVDGVTQRYGTTVALNAVTIDLPAGCMVGFIGPMVLENRRC